MTHAYLTLECESCKSLGRKTVIAIKYLGVYTGTQYDISECSMFFKVPCYECGKTGHYEKSNVEVSLFSWAPPSDFQDMV